MILMVAAICLVYSQRLSKVLFTMNTAQNRRTDIADSKSIEGMKSRSCTRDGKSVARAKKKYICAAH